MSAVETRSVVVERGMRPFLVSADGTPSEGVYPIRRGDQIQISWTLGFPVLAATAVASRSPAMTPGRKKLSRPQPER